VFGDELTSCLHPPAHVDRAAENDRVESIKSFDSVDLQRFCVEATLDEPGCDRARDLLLAS
jgi:hypothetical protein